MCQAITSFRFLQFNQRCDLSHWRLTFLAVWIVCLATIANCTFAQNSNTADTKSGDLVALNMRDADIRALIQWVAEQTHKQIVIDPRVQGRVSAFADKPMTVSQTYQVFLALLEVYGFSSSETDGILRIYPSALAKTSPRAVIDDFNNLNNSTQVVYVLDIKNVSSAAMAQIIKPLLSTSGYIASLDSSNSLVIADNGDTVKRLVELTHRLDRSGSLDIDVVKLQHASARDVAQVLASLVSPGSGTQNAGANTSASLSIAADERSNSILLAGEPGSRERAQQLIAQLDQPLTAATSSRVVFLNYLTAEELVPVLKSITNSSQKEAKEEAVKNAAVSIEASKSNNAIVMSGPPDLLDSMRDIITKLDVQRAQVLVEAIIVEVSADITNDLGVLWATTNVADLNGSGAVAGVNTLGSLQALGAVTGIDADGNPVVQAAPGNGLTLGYYTNGNLQAAIRALSTNSKANILSTPSVLTLDNQQAQIMVGSNIPLITGQSTGPASSADNPFTTYERKDIGVTLKITPQINANKSVTLDILQEIQTVAGAVQTALAGASDIVTNKRSITTKVLVSDDKTLVLGGLISDQNEDVQSKVPILGDLPLIGRLFRSTHNKSTKQNLLVFIHPVVIDSDETATKISRAQYDDMRVHQMQYRDGKIESTRPPTLPEFEQISPQKKNDETPAATNPTTR